MNDSITGCEGEPSKFNSCGPPLLQWWYRPKLPWQFKSINKLKDLEEGDLQTFQL